MAELVDALDSKSSDFGRAGSIPAQGTLTSPAVLLGIFYFMYYVYAIASLDRNYIYVGLTNNVERRLMEHDKGKEKTTAPYKPFILIFTEECTDRLNARIREKYWKSGTGKRQLRNIRDEILSKK